MNTAFYDSGVRRFGRTMGGWWSRMMPYVLPMKRKPDGSEKLDQSAMAWRGFWTALLGYIAAHLTTLPPSGSQTEENKRFASLEEKITNLDKRVSAFIDSFVANPAARRK